MRAKALWFPNLKLVPEPDERDGVRDRSVSLQFVAQDHPALAVHLQRLARAVERDRELFPFLRVERIALDHPFDLGEERIAPGVDRRLVQGRIAVEAFEAVAGEHRAKRSRDRDAPLGIEPRRDVRHEAVHHSTPPGYAPRLRWVEPRFFVGCFGI